MVVGEKEEEQRVEEKECDVALSCMHYSVMMKSSSHRWRESSQSTELFWSPEQHTCPTPSQREGR